MKKLIIILLPILVFILGTKCYAFSESDVTNLRNTFYNQFNVTMNETYARNLLTFWEQNGNNYPYMGMQKTSSNKYAFIIGQERQGNSTQWGFYGYKTSDVTDPTTATTITWAISSPAQMLLTMQGNLKIGPWSSWHTVPIEWNNPQYNPNMPIPEFTTNYGEISVNSSSPAIPFDIEFKNPSSDYFIEIYVNYWIPDNMSISINRNYQYNDGYVYKALSRELVNDYLIDPEQMLKISGINNFKLQLQTSWENALDEVPIASIEYANPNSLPSGMFTQYKNTYENYCRRILGFYGSQFTIMMRYFTIVNDTDYIIGAWRTWTSYSPNEFTERIPDYYVPYVPASGQENITNDVDPETVSVVSGSGTNTGVVADPNYYITVNQNTPNYPDYPTVASYNKDNLLLDTINQMNSLSQFFGEFSDFLTMSFSFFPAWIWAIIGVGFSISIVVMFLKIL